jgi:tetratricopeptide (TPR) repeat protein
MGLATRPRRLVSLESPSDVTTEPLNFEFKLAEFDLNLLPIDGALLQADPALLQRAVVDYFTAKFKPMGGTTNIAVRDGNVAVSWLPASLAGREELFAYAMSLLHQGAYKQAEPILRALRKHGEDENGMIALNLGMVLSDQQQLDEALVLLREAVEKSPTSADAWNSLGIAYQRKRELKPALDALRKSHELAPENPYTLRNLAALLLESSSAESLIYAKRAADLLPGDQRTLFGYAVALERNGDPGTASTILKRAINVAPFTQLAEACRAELTKLAHSGMRERGGELRMDVVHYLISAIETFGNLGKQKTGLITYEIAMLGRSGLDINDPTPKYTLKSLEGSFSALQLLAHMYAGVKQLSPGDDPGVDFSKEYEQALSMRRGE